MKAISSLVNVDSIDNDKNLEGGFSAESQSYQSSRITPLITTAVASAAPRASALTGHKYSHRGTTSSLYFLSERFFSKNANAMIDGAREQPLHGNLKAVSDLPYRKAEEAKSMSLNMQPLSDKFGVAITNVDLSKDIDQSLFNEIVDAFVKKQVLVFRNQHIEPQHQVAFSRRFGPLEMLYDEDQRVPGFPEVAILSNEKVDGKFIGVVAAGDFWHSAQSYRRETSLATFLYAHKLPKHGGDTEFADMHGAYESLPDDIKKRIEGRMGIHHDADNLRRSR